MNMCSVRQRPMPWAPNSRALAASSGVSALARTFSRRMLVGPAEDRLEVLVDLRRDEVDLADDHAPVPPSIVIVSPSASSWPPIVDRPRRRGRSTGPRSRRRTACPSRARRRRRARSCRRARSGSPAPGSGRGCRPGSSPSGRGSRPRPARPRFSAVSASSTIAPQAAPGEAFRPCAATSTSAFGSIIGCSSWSSWPGSIRATASSRVIRPSSTICDGGFAAPPRPCASPSASAGGRACRPRP